MLEIDSLSCSYGLAQILNGVSLSVSEGEVVALLGRNGMGKTSLVRCIFGQRPPQITNGKILFGGKDLITLSNYKIPQQGIALVPQGRRVFRSLSVKENLTIVANNTGEWSISEIYKLFPQLEARSNSRGGDLSGGEQQMLAIGRALITNPRFLIMDEPSEGLAPIVLEEIRKRMRLLKERGLTTLIVEQNVGLALELADRIYVLGSQGFMVWTTTPEEFKKSPDLQQRYLGV